MSRGDTQPLAQVLEQFIKRVGLKEPMQESGAVFLWGDIVGSSLARVSRAERLEEGILQVRVRSSAWAQQLSLLHAELLKRYQDRVGAGVVRGFRFVVGTLRERVSSEGDGGEVVSENSYQRAADESTTTSPPELDAALAHWTETRRQELDVIDDEALRAAVNRWLSVMKSRRARVLKRGGSRCRRCGAVIEPGRDICPSCLVELDGTASRRLRDFLEDFPWLDDETACARVEGSDKKVTRRARDELTRELESELHRDIPEFLAGRMAAGESRLRLKRILCTAVMLKTGSSPEDVNRRRVFATLGPQAAEAWGRILEDEKRRL